MCVFKWQVKNVADFRLHLLPEFRTLNLLGGNRQHSLAHIEEDDLPTWASFPNGQEPSTASASPAIKDPVPSPDSMFNQECTASLI
jgi:hypothetical protein